eukprot:TRINITY_DN3779_c0_g1_i1.p1 TRINITY_DN3779_c0_g1~~TRINITY_DN3779_c0_g1_i1.p1  ORF type:complete len:838 (+),score=253.64 TRINITY_DN3779_c0_g1_i1:48-2516(+)
MEDELAVRGSPIMIPSGSKSSGSLDSNLKRSRSNTTTTPPTPVIEPTAGRSRTSSLIINNEKEANRRRKLPLAGISKVLADATRVAEALGKAQQARIEREDRAMGIIRDMPQDVQPPESPCDGDEDEQPPRDIEAVSPPSLGDGPEVFQDLVPEPLVAEEECAEETGDPEPEHEHQYTGAPHEILDDDEMASEDIAVLCSIRVECVLSGDYEHADEIREKLWRNGVLLDDIEGTWTASSGANGEYQALGGLSSSPSGSPGGRSNDSQSPQRVKPIGDEAYHRLLGKKLGDEEVIRLQAERDLRREEEMRYQNHLQYSSPTHKRGASSSRAPSASPNINQPSTPDPTHKIKSLAPGERLYFAGAAREQIKQHKLQQEREAKILDEMSRLSRGPVITTKAKTIKGGFAQRQAEWADKIKASRAEAVCRRDKENELQSQEPRRVVMSKKSEELTRNGTQGPVKNWSERFEKHCKARGQQEVDPYMFKPNITATAARMHRKGNSGDRLYNDAAVRAMKHEERVNQATEKAMYDSTTGRPRYTPKISTKHSSPPPSPPSQVRGSVLFTRVAKKPTEHSDPDAVIHRLLSHGQEAERRRLQKENDNRSAQSSYKPTLSKTTREIVSRIERKPLYETQSKEQQGGVQHGSVLFSKSAHGTGGGMSTYAGSVADSERSLTNASPEQFAARSAMHEQQRRQKLEKLRRSKDDAEMQACTFAPNICTTSKAIFRKAQAADKRSHSSTPADMYYEEPPQYASYECAEYAYGTQYTYAYEVPEQDEEEEEDDDADDNLYHYNDYVSQPSYARTASDAQSALLNWRRLSSTLDQD